ncbi:hypothetical protein LTR28_005484, partial [Elasticomyces elasticus]
MHGSSGCGQAWDMDDAILADAEGETGRHRLREIEIDEQGGRGAHARDDRDGGAALRGCLVVVVDVVVGGGGGGEESFEVGWKTGGEVD